MSTNKSNTGYGYIKREDEGPVRQALLKLVAEKTEPIYLLMIEYLDDGRIGIGIHYQSGRQITVVMDEGYQTIQAAGKSLVEEWKRSLN